MDGLTLSKGYYWEYKEELLKDFPEYKKRIAAGLVGFGSECFGFDDKTSQDHDWGPGFCIWLTDEDYAKIGAQMQEAYDALPKEYAGYPARQTNNRSGKRVGIFSISEFYAKFLGAPELPISDADWLQIPDEYLSMAVNGEVFEDFLGEFTKIRSKLLEYFPENVYRVKLAQCVAKMSQSGQYNYHRALERNDYVTAHLYLSQFIKYTCTFVCLINKIYTPFKKWMHRTICNVPILSDISDMLEHLCHLEKSKRQEEIEEICRVCLDTLISLGYTTPGDSFLETHVDDILPDAYKQRL